MDRILKGKDFEDRVFDLIYSELTTGKLGVLAHRARVFKRKGYYSKDRHSVVIVDISIEIWLPKAMNYSFLWVCECKDYKRRVPVDDIEEFKAKLDQIAGKNVKGIIAASSAFQKSALNYAISNGIGVLRVLPEGEVDWVVHIGNDSTQPGELNAGTFLEALIVPAYHSKLNKLYGLWEGNPFNDIGFLLRKIIECGD